MNPRWRVRREPRSTGYFWYADPPMWGEKYRGNHTWNEQGGKKFDTWPAAIKYAQQKAREISVSLPPGAVDAYSIGQTIIRTLRKEHQCFSTGCCLH